MKSESKAVIKLETHTALLGADEILKEARVGGSRGFYGGKPVSGGGFRVAYVFRGDNSSVTFGLRLPHKRTITEYETSVGIFSEGDFVNALVIEDSGAYRIVGL